MDDGQAFCDKCGHKAGTAVRDRYATVLREKNEGVAALLSLLWGGAGQIYVGKLVRGLAIMAAYFVILLIGVPILFLGGLGTAVVWIILCGILYFVLWIWNIFDAYNLAKAYNDHLWATGTRPW
ncbi:MAG: hypothetical protein FWH44_02430 [Methanomassiliicoccaceae archaeon]|nr:hypothetical protein [Methanomassiliicoccaceae archaeon]